MTDKPTTLQPSAACLSIIREFEGFRAKAYKCPAGVWTVGFGTTVGVTSTSTMTLAQAVSRLEAEVQAFASGVRMIAGTCTQAQFDALVSFAYNCGLTNLKRSTLLRYHLAAKHKLAQTEFLKWNKGSGKILPGLVRRRAAEAKLYGAA